MEDSSDHGSASSYSFYDAKSTLSGDTTGSDTSYSFTDPPSNRRKSTFSTAPPQTQRSSVNSSKDRNVPSAANLAPRKTITLAPDEPLGERKVSMVGFGAKLTPKELRKRHKNRDNEVIIICVKCNPTQLSFTAFLFFVINLVFFSTGSISFFYRNKYQSLSLSLSPTVFPFILLGYFFMSV